MANHKRKAQRNGGLRDLKKSGFGWALVWLLVSHPAWAQTGPVMHLTWPDCVRAARLNNPDLVSSEQELRQAEADQRITRSGALPQFSSDLNARSAKTSSADDASDTYAYGVTGQQLLFDGLKTSKDIAAAGELIRASQYNYAVSSSNIRLDLHTAFAQLLRAQSLVPLTETIAQRRQQNLAMIQLRYEAGREHKGSLLTAQADLAEALFEAEQAKRNLVLAQSQLITRIGWQDRREIIAVGEFRVTEENTAPEFAALADSTPFLLELAARKEAARFNLGSDKADFFPEVYLNSSAGKTSAHWPPDQDSWMVGLSISFPLFEGGRRTAQVAKSEAALRQAEAERRSGRDSVLLILEQAWKGLKDAVDAVTVQEKFLEAARERAKIADAQYSSGLISFDDWIIIENNLVSSQKTYLDTQANVLVAEAQWVQAKGGILEDEQDTP